MNDHDVLSTRKKIIDQQRLILIIKTTHESGRGLTCNKKKNQKESENLTYANRKIDWSNLKSLSRGSILLSQFFNQMTREIELLERIQRTLEKWFLEK